VTKSTYSHYIDTVNMSKERCESEVLKHRRKSKEAWHRDIFLHALYMRHSSRLTMVVKTSA